MREQNENKGKQIQTNPTKKYRLQRWVIGVGVPVKELIVGPSSKVNFGNWSRIGLIDVICNKRRFT